MDTEEMEGNNYVDTSSPFSSVKEAVAQFGHQIMLPIQTHTLNSKPVSPIANRSFYQTAKPTSPIASISQTASSSSSPRKQRSLLPSTPQGTREEIMDILKKLEAEMTETKTEVNVLKESESETEVALATVNTEQHKNIAKAEVEGAGKSTKAMAKSVSFKELKDNENREDERRKELIRRMQKEYPALSQILDSNKRDEYGHFAKSKKTKKKKKPIIPLVGEFFFFKKKISSTEISGPLYTAPSTLHF